MITNTKQKEKCLAIYITT